jgi:hypothetical protein
MSQGGFDAIVIAAGSRRWSRYAAVTTSKLGLGRLGLVASPRRRTTFGCQAQAP